MYDEKKTLICLLFMTNTKLDFFLNDQKNYDNKHTSVLNHPKCDKHWKCRYRCDKHKCLLIL